MDDDESVITGYPDPLPRSPWTDEDWQAVRDRIDWSDEAA